MRIGQQNESVAKQWDDNAGREIKLNINGVIEEIADHGNVDTAVIRECRYAARGT